MKALLARGADVNAKEREHQQTALMWAAAQRHPEVVRLLIEAGADIRARSLTYPQTVVGEQTQRAGREELNYTVLRGGSTPLLFAARVGDAESARLLLKAGADAERRAAGRRQRAGARGPQRQRAGRRAAARARRRSRMRSAAATRRCTRRSCEAIVKLVKALLARGANPNLRITKGTPMRRDTTDWNLPATLIGSTPYLLAARFLEPDIMSALVAGGADPRLTHAERRGRRDAGGGDGIEPDREPARHRDDRFRQGRTGKPRARGR